MRFHGTQVIQPNHDQRTDQPNSSYNESSSKRKLSQGKYMTHAELVAYDIKRARREKECTKAKPSGAAITLSHQGTAKVSPNMLSQKLRDRFAHIFTHLH